MKSQLHINKACRFFPCHKRLEDCTFCYCLFYPCLNEARGSFVYSQRLKKNIWSCQECNWIHSKKAVDGILDLIRNKRCELTAMEQKQIDKKTGIIIIGHGTRLKKANALLTNVIRTVKSVFPLSIILPAHLQFYQPDFSKSIKKLINKGCKKIIIVPFFLFKGNHVSRDIPNAIIKEAARYPDVKFIYTQSLGEDKRIGYIVADRIRIAMEEKND